MGSKLNIILGALIFYVACVLFINYPFIVASFDDDKYIDGEVFKTENGEYDFRLFTLNSSKTRNYTTIVQKSGHTQFVDNKGNHTINVFEWNKMTSAQKDNVNANLMIELGKPYHMSNGVKIIETEYFADFYGASINNSDNSISIYIVTPTEEETIEMINTLEFKKEDA